MASKKQPLKSSRFKKTKPSKRLAVYWASAAAALVVLVVAGLFYGNRPGPVNAIFSRLSGNPPLVQPGTTDLLTAKGLASSSSVLVKFRPSVAAATAAVIHSQIGAHVDRAIPGIGVQEVSLPAGMTVGDGLAKYRSHAEVAYAEPDFLAQRFMTPNDTLYAKQWNLAKINAGAAWDVSQGGYGPVAIIDTGIDAAHSDLTGEVTSGYNFVNNSTNTNDDNGHGTHVAGIIAGETNNSNGVASIGFNGLLMPVKVLDSSGTGTYGAVADGIVFAADHGARIINMSLGGSSASQTLQDAVNYAEQKGVIVVAAAGNNGNTAAVYPADYAGVIAVSATTDTDTLASFSSYGSHIFLSAPGVDITSTYNNGGYATMSGTSMAAPEVAGLISLALAHSQVSLPTLLSDLQQSSDKVGPYPYDANGWNQYFGYGRIDAGKLLQLISGSTAVPAAPAPTQTTTNGQTVHGQAGMQFSVDFEGIIDSIEPTNNLVVVKIQTISSNLSLADNNLVNIYLDQGSTIKSGGQSLSLGDLSVGQQIGGKALWQNNQLTATNLIVQGGTGGAAHATGDNSAAHRQ